MVKLSAWLFSYRNQQNHDEHCGSRAMNGISVKTPEFKYKLLNLKSPFWDCNNIWYNGLGARFYLCKYWKELYQFCFFHCGRNLCHKSIHLLMQVLHTATDTVQNIPESPCHNDFWDADVEWNAGVAEVQDHLLEMLSFFRGLQSNPGEKKYSCGGQSLGF